LTGVLVLKPTRVGGKPASKGITVGTGVGTGEFTGVLLLIVLNLL
jgi:hypothetical protein